MMNTSKTYTTKDLEEITGMSAKNLHGYISAGKIMPDVQSAGGSGTVILLSASNLLQAMMLHECIKIGLPRRTIFKMLDSLNQNGDMEKLNPFEIAGYENKLFLHFLSSPSVEITHLFDLVRGNNAEDYKNYPSELSRWNKGMIDLTDYEGIIMSIRFNLSAMSTLLLKKLLSH